MAGPAWTLEIEVGGPTNGGPMAIALHRAAASGPRNPRVADALGPLGRGYSTSPGPTAKLLFCKAIAYTVDRPGRELPAPLALKYLEC